MISPEIRYILALFLTTRVILTIVGVVARAVFDPVLEPLRASHTVWWVFASQRPLLDIWGVGDTEWYLDIARNGYSIATQRPGQANYAFFPLYPALMRILGALFGDAYAAGLVISNVSLIIACIGLFKLARLEEDERTALTAAKYLLLYPTAFVFSGVLSESLYLTLLVGCFYFARRQRWWVVGILGFFLSLTRSIGVFALLPLLYEYGKTAHWDLKRMKSDVLYLLLVPCGFLVFAAYAYSLTGDVFAYLHVEGGWAGSRPNSWSPMVFGDVRALVGILFGFMACMYLLMYYQQIGFSYWLTGMYSILLPLVGGTLAALYSMPRFTAVVFPLYILLAKVRSKNPHSDQITAAALAILQGALMILWTNGSYVAL